MSRSWVSYWPGYWVDRRLRGMPVTLLIAALSTLATHGLPAYAQRTTVFDLDQAICANDWRGAVNIVGMLVADSRTTNGDRNALLDLRRQLERFRAENFILADAQACDRTNPYLLEVTLPPTVQTGEPLGWEGAVAAATHNRYSTQVVTEGEAFALPVSIGSPAGLTPAEPVDLSQGLNVVAGHIGPGHQVYGFVAGLGDRLNINLAVTQVMTGTLYTSDDSQLFVFDRHGMLIAAADDTHGGQQSHIDSLVLPKTDLYFVVVTSYNNDPILDRAGRLTGWPDNGGGRFDYTLSVSGATPTSALIR